METVTEKILDVVVNIDIDIPEDCDMEKMSFADFAAVYRVEYRENGEFYSEYDFPVDAGFGYISIEDIIDADMRTDNISEYEIFDIQDMGDHITAKVRIKNPV